MESPKATVHAKADGVYAVSCSGEFGQNTIGQLAATCDGIDAGAKLVVLDVKNVTFADSSFLNTLIRLRSSRRLVLQGPLPGQLYRLLQLTGALALFPLRNGGAPAS
ncbi:STAS domain-containing protein [Streptomyces zaomyceticus]|uniref:STAS domain-containing protein n=1 Tax=Streptomyces zaomyceticus TaxID=68286 RepID=UPI003434F24B